VACGSVPDRTRGKLIDKTSRQSWHGRERLPAGAGIRNTLLNTFYAEPRDGFSGYLEHEAETPELASMAQTSERDSVLQ